MKLSVYHAPERVPSEGMPDCAIAVDVLRATTTIATALEAGADSIQVFSDISSLMTVSAAWEPSQRIRIGERGGKTVEGCDYGNSPLDCQPERVKGARIFMSTTNGTRALACIQAAPVVLTGAFVNRQAVVEYLLNEQPNSVWIVGSGWQGSYSLEDTACAGAILDGLIQDSRSTVSLADLAGNDEAIAAVALYRQFQADLVGLLKLASHGQRLLRLGLIADLEYCAKTDLLPTLPIQVEPGILGSAPALARSSV